MSATEAGTNSTPGPRGDSASPGGRDRRWFILAVIATAQLMVVLDGTVVNIALPSAQRALHFTDTDRQWIITGYALAFGSLLLLGGKLGDLFGRKPAFMTGLIGFAAASAIGGASNGFDMLVSARVCQGVFGAVLAPAGLSLLTTTFPDKKERGVAFGVYGAIIGAGGAVGLLLGGVLTEYLSWRWCLYVNLVFAVAGLVGATVLLPNGRPSVRPRLDLPGTVAVSGSMFCLVYGFSNADTHTWSTPSTWGFLTVGAVLLAVFLLLMARLRDPLLPLRIVADRNRGGAYLAIFLLMAGVAGVFLFLTYYLQETLGYSPVATGLAYLPMLLTAVVGGIISNLRLLPRFGPKPLVATGMVIAAGGMAWLTNIGPHSSYAADLLGPLLVAGLGMGITMSPSTNTATFRLPPADAGVASAATNTQQQIGNSIGTSLLNTLAVSAASHYAVSHAASSPSLAAQVQSQAAIHGYIVAFWWAAGIIFVGAILCGSLLRRGRLDQIEPEPTDAGGSGAPFTTSFDAAADPQLSA